MQIVRGATMRHGNEDMGNGGWETVVRHDRDVVRAQRMSLPIGRASVRNSMYAVAQDRPAQRSHTPATRTGSRTVAILTGYLKLRDPGLQVRPEIPGGQ